MEWKLPEVLTLFYLSSCRKTWRTLSYPPPALPPALPHSRTPSLFAYRRAKSRVFPRMNIIGHVTTHSSPGHRGIIHARLRRAWDERDALERRRQQRALRPPPFPFPFRCFDTYIFRLSFLSHLFFNGRQHRLSGLFCRSHLLCPRTFLIPHASSTCWQGSTGKQRGAITVPGPHPIDVHVSSPVCVMEGVASFRGKPFCHFLFLGKGGNIARTGHLRLASARSTTTKSSTLNIPCQGTPGHGMRTSHSLSCSQPPGSMRFDGALKSNNRARKAASARIILSGEKRAMPYRGGGVRPVLTVVLRQK